MNSFRLFSLTLFSLNNCKNSTLIFRFIKISTSKTDTFQLSRYGTYRASTEDLYTRPSRRKPLPDLYQSTSKRSTQSREQHHLAEENEYDSLEHHRRREPPAPLKLPNYYPDSICESDNTEYASAAENRSVAKKFQSCDNLPAQNFQQGPESIPYDDNIVLSKNRPLYGSLQEAAIEKPKTIRSHSVQRQEEYFSAPIRRNLEEKVDTKDEPDENKIEIYATVEINPVYEQANGVEIKIEDDRAETRSPELDNHATNLEIYFNDQINDDSKTIIKVDDCSNSTDEEIKEEPKKEQKHSHKYLREFLESQKGSKKPLQNFLAKKFPNLSRRNSKEKQTNLIDNNFYSLPDITACKNLKKCDKIDRKLRKCDKISKSGESDDRFIVNIGKHFDVTSNNNIPVDFELKIAKIPKKNRLDKEKPDVLIQAIQDLKKTLGENLEKRDTKPEIIAVQRKTNTDSDIEEKETMNDNQTGIEYQDKLDNMRNYWKKLTGQEIPKQPETETEPTIKIEEVKKKFETNTDKTEQTNKVKITKEIFENKSDRRHFVKPTKGLFENPAFEKENPFESLNPNVVEVVESSPESKEPQLRKNNTTERRKDHSPVTKSLSITYPEFDHVRYRVVKSNLFQKKIFTNCEKESQFEGLMQYLQDYSFQELLMDNNIVIIEPIRTTLIRESNNKYKNPAKNITPLLHTNIEEKKNEKNTLKKHFFFHPIRVNKEVNDDELPNPDTVKQVRQLFEKNEDKIIKPMKKLIENKAKISSEKKPCLTTKSETCSDEQWDSYDEEACCEQQYITEDMMEKIRKCGTTITYYGGRIVRKQSSQDSLTNVILEEIKNNETRKDDSQRLKFKLVKSNSCSSRMELVGTKNIALSKQKYKNKQEIIKKQLEEEQNKLTENNNDEKTLNKNEINEYIKKQSLQKQDIDNKIYTKWGESTREQTIYGIHLNEKMNDPKVIHDYHTNFERSKNKGKVIEDMDFEPFEIA